MRYRRSAARRPDDLRARHRLSLGERRDDRGRAREVAADDLEDRFREDEIADCIEGVGKAVERPEHAAPVLGVERVGGERQRRRGAGDEDLEQGAVALRRERHVRLDPLPHRIEKAESVDDLATHRVGSRGRRVDARFAGILAAELEDESVEGDVLASRRPRGSSRSS